MRYDFDRVIDRMGTYSTQWDYAADRFGRPDVLPFSISDTDFAVPDEVILERMSGRRVHVASGRTYHVKFNPPKVEGVDDVTGEPLIQRPDDKEETVKKRLEVYHTQTEALVGFYQSLAAKGDSKTKYIKIDGVGDVNEVSRRIFDALDR